MRAHGGGGGIVRAAARYTVRCLTGIGFALVSHWHLYNRGGRVMVGVFLQQALNVGDPTLRFFAVDLTCLMFTGDLVKKMFKKGFHRSDPFLL